MQLRTPRLWRRKVNNSLSASKGKGAHDGAYLEQRILMSTIGSGEFAINFTVPKDDVTGRGTKHHSLWQESLESYEGSQVGFTRFRIMTPC